MTTLLRWPVCTLTPKDILASPSKGAAVNGGRTLSGRARKIAWGAGGLWRASYLNIKIRTRDQILAAQALDAYLDAGATRIIVPRLPASRNPDGPVGYVPHSDGSSFSDGSLYAGEGSDTYIGGAVSRSATEIEIDRPLAATLLTGGEDFSLIDPDGLPEMHRIARILDAVVAGERRVYTVSIRVPMRSDAVAARELNFRNPAFVATLDNPEEFAAVLEGHRSGTFTAEWTEA